jgi:hypothetical protein
MTEQEAVKLSAETKMTPTNKLRWIEREHEVGLTGNMVHVETVLQQWWAPFHKFHDGFGYTEQELKGGEWRDVLIEKE